jgi:Skp family chaperone for outer membrane proteins
LAAFTPPVAHPNFLRSSFMHVRRFRVNWPAVLIAAAFCVFAGYQTMAVQRLAQLKPAVIATVDLEVLFNHLDEWKDAIRSLQQLEARQDAEEQERAAAIRRFEEELELFPPGSEKHQQALNQYALAAAELQTFREFRRWKSEVEQSIALRRIYTNVRQAVKLEAAARGCDVVFSNDSLGEIPHGDHVDTMRQIALRRMLYANSDLDITQDVVARMNAAFKPAG